MNLHSVMIPNLDFHKCCNRWDLRCSGMSRSFDW